MEHQGHNKTASIYIYIITLKYKLTKTLLILSNTGRTMDQNLDEGGSSTAEAPLPELEDQDKDEQGDKHAR